MAVLGFSVVQACRFTENDVLCEWMAGANGPEVHTPTGMQQRRNSLRFAPFGPPTVSCVLAVARTCIRQAPPTSRGRGPATSAVLPVRSATSATLEKAMKKGGRDFRPPFVRIN